VVILRYPNAYADARLATGGNVNYANTGGYKIYKFSASGTITF
jgi:hypothetical protein